MHIAFNAGDFNHGMGMVSHALPVRPTTPTIHENVMLETAEDGVRLTVTDGEVMIRSTVAAQVSEEGRALLPARLLGEFVKNLEGDVTLETDGEGRASVHSRGSRARMVLADPENYPDIAFEEPESVTILPQQRFKSAVGSIIFALAADESRRILTGCLMETGKSEVRFVCLDGYRLAMQRVESAHELPPGREYLSHILPGTLVGNIARMLPDAEQPITISLGKTHMRAEFGKTVVYAPLIQGEYINYRQILPTSWTTAARVGRKTLQEAIHRGSLIAREGSNNLLRLRLEDQAMTISANAEAASVTEQLPIDFDGTPLSIAFNAGYLSDVVKNIDTDDLSMRFNTSVSPCVVGPVSGDQYTYLVLPVRVSE
jgi:DNA polymerase-3 subunit beta